MSIPLSATGVYIIANLVNGKTYVGSAARSFKSRFGNHLSRLRRGGHHSRHLQSAWSKYGEESFVFMPVVEVAPEDCIAVEQEWIDGWAPAYNTARVAGSTLGTAHAPETKAKIGEVARRSVLAAKHRANLADAKRGQPLSLEHRAKIAARGAGRKHSPETIARMRVSAAASWDVASRRDRVDSPETRLMKGAAMRGKTQDPSHVAKRIAASIATKARKNAERK